MNSYESILSFEENIYKQLYEEGKQQRNQNNSKITLALTIIISEAGALIWCIFKVINNIENYKDERISCYTFSCVFTFIAACFWISAIMLFVLCLTNYKFTYINALEVSLAIQDNKKYLEYYSEKEVLNNIQIDIIDGYKKASIENFKETNKHSRYLKKCYICLIITLLFLIVGFLFILFI